MKLQKMQQEEDQPNQLSSGGGTYQGVMEKPTCRINKEAKPMLQILDSNTPTSNKLQILPSPLRRTDAASTGRANAPVVADEDDDMAGFELQKAKEGGRKRSSLFDGWSEAEEESGRERLKKHRVEVAMTVWIPDIWGQEDFLMDWIDCSDFDSALAPKGVNSARAALAEEGRRAHSGRLSVENTC